jgi:hypothetical protein
MSALRPKADVLQLHSHVRFVPKADIAPFHARLTRPVISFLVPTAAKEAFVSCVLFSVAGFSLFPWRVGALFLGL